MTDGPHLAINGQRVISLRLTIPYYGAWVADVVLAQSTPIAPPVTLTVGTLTLLGAILRVASFGGSRSARLVAGYGGWRKTIPAQGYQKSSGVNASLVLRDAASIVGEQVSVANDASLGSAFTRESAPAERVLRQVAGSEWFIDPKGVTQIGPRTSVAVTSSFTVVQWSGAKGQFEIATEDIAQWMPGNTFTAPTVSGTQTIGLTSIVAENDGKLRLSVLAAS